MSPQWRYILIQKWTWRHGETKETRETNGNTKVDMETLKETKETVETSGDMYKYKGRHGETERD